jgi:hypothetical protein
VFLFFSGAALVIPSRQTRLRACAAALIFRGRSRQVTIEKEMKSKRIAAA